MEFPGDQSLDSVFPLLRAQVQSLGGSGGDYDPTSHAAEPSQKKRKEEMKDTVSPAVNEGHGDGAWRRDGGSETVSKGQQERHLEKWKTYRVASEDARNQVFWWSRFCQQGWVISSPVLKKSVETARLAERCEPQRRSRGETWEWRIHDKKP